MAVSHAGKSDYVSHILRIGGKISMTAQLKLISTFLEGERLEAWRGYLAESKLNEDDALREIVVEFLQKRRQLRESEEVLEKRIERARRILENFGMGSAI